MPGASGVDAAFADLVAATHTSWSNLDLERRLRALGKHVDRNNFKSWCCYRAALKVARGSGKPDVIVSHIEALHAAVKEQSCFAS